MTVPITVNAVGDIIALGQLGLGFVQRLNNARGAKAEYREVQSRLESLNSLLELCAATVNTLSDSDHKSIVTAQIDRARTQIDAALRLLPGYERLAVQTHASSEPTNRSILTRVRDASECLNWELRHSEIAQACLVKLSESIQMIQLAIIAANGANANTQFQSISSTVTNAASVTNNVQSDISVIRALLESMNARLPSVPNALSSNAVRHAVTSETQAGLLETMVTPARSLSPAHPNMLSFNAVRHAVTPATQATLREITVRRARRPSTADPWDPPLRRRPEGQPEAVIPPTPAPIPRPDLNPLIRPRGLTYNLLFESNIATNNRGTLTEYQRAQPATNPAVRRMVILPVWSRSRSLPAALPRGLIEVESSISRAHPVALIEVLDAVRKWLHEPVDQDGWMRSSQEEQRISGTSFQERVRLAGSPVEQEYVRIQGLKRIDYLGDNKYFGGLIPLPHQPEIWKLELSANVAQ